MKLVDLKCPNCNSVLEQEGENLVCRACGSVFALDYDFSDVEHERLKNEATQKRMSKKTGVIILIALLCIGGITSYITSRDYFARLNSSATSSQPSRPTPTVTPVPTPKPTPTPAPNYNVTPLDISGQLDDFIESGNIMEMNEKDCSDWDAVGPLINYTKTSVDFLNAYIITDIPETSPKQSNRLVVFYKITWNNDKEGDKICYDAVYFNGLRVNPNGGVTSDYSAQTIFRSQAGWGWPFPTCFEDYDQCYRENVTALGGKVEEIKKEENSD